MENIREVSYANSIDEYRLPSILSTTELTKSQEMINVERYKNLMNKLNSRLDNYLKDGKIYLKSPAPKITSDLNMILDSFILYYKTVSKLIPISLPKSFFALLEFADWKIVVKTLKVLPVFFEETKHKSDLTEIGELCRSHNPAQLK